MKGSWALAKVPPRPSKVFLFVAILDQIDEHLGVPFLGGFKLSLVMNDACYN
jgi:hypothetical protein